MRLLFPDGEHPHVTLGSGATRIGSDREADVVLERSGVQARHCEVLMNPQGVVLQVAERAEVSVNDRPVSGVISLRAGDSIAIHGVQMRLAQVDAEAPGKANGNGAAAGSQVNGAVVDDMSTTAVRPAMPRYALQGMSGMIMGHAFPVVGTTLIGRGQDCQLPFNVAGLSRQHARLTPMDKGIWIEDLGSTNGCFIDGRKVRSALAAPGTEVSFDELRFRVVAPSVGRAAETPVATMPQERTVPLKWVVAGAAGALVVILALLLF